MIEQKRFKVEIILPKRCQQDTIGSMLILCEKDEDDETTEIITESYFRCS